MKPLRRGLLTAALAGSLLTGGAVGASVFGTAASNAATTTTTAAASGPAANGPPPSGTFKSNETAAHEAGESAAREAQETAGTFPTVP
jgi:hypothetical protein